MKFLSVVIFGLIYALASFAVAPSAQAASLSYFVPTPSGVAWKWFDASRKTILHVHRFSEKPLALYWERNGGIVLAMTGQKILAFDRHGVRVPDADIPTPSFGDEERPVILWRDAGTKRLRLATQYDVPDKDVGGSLEAPVLTDATGKQISGLSFPDWGLHVILKVYELSQPENTALPDWQAIATVPTKMYAADVPGLSVLKPYWDEDGHGDAHLLASKLCRTGGALYPGRICHLGDDKETRAAFLELAFPQCGGKIRGCPIEAVGKVACDGCLYDLFHASILGDRLNTAFPVFLRHNETGTFTPLNHIANGKISGKDGDQVLIGLGGHYVVMELLGESRHISVLDLMTGELILHTKGEGAFWLPH